MIYTLSDMIGFKNNQTEVDSCWVRLVPMPFKAGLFGRLKAALSVLIGSSYAVRWPEPGELEAAYHREV